MKILAVFETKAGARLSRSASRESPTRNLAMYYSPGSEIEIRCSTDEAEEFERDTSASLADDVLTAPMFLKLTGWLQENAGLTFRGLYAG